MKIAVPTRSARSLDPDEQLEEPDARHDPQLDRRYEAHVYSRDVIVEAYLEGRL